MASTDNAEDPLDRWSLTRFALDANGDGQLTTADLYSHLHALFFLPGDAFLLVLSTYAAPVARFCAVGPGDYGGIVSAVVSSCAWFIVLMLSSIAYHSVLDFDRRVTGATHRLFTHTVLRVRIASTLFRQRCRAVIATLRRKRRTVVVPEVDLTAAQVRVLQLHAALKAGQSLTVSEAARAMEARNAPTGDLLAGLSDLGLLNRALGGIDDETSYTLSAAGKALLAFQQRRGGRAPPSARA